MIDYGIVITDWKIYKKDLFQPKYPSEKVTVYY